MNINGIDSKKEQTLNNLIQNVQICQNGQVKEEQQQQVVLKSYSEIESAKVSYYYANDIINSLKKRDINTRPKDCLANHKIPSSLRAKMVDWMVEVLSSYKCSDQTYFVSIYYMDKFFQASNISYDVQDLHLTGVTSMFIATKYEEIYPLKLSVIHEKIAHKKLSIEQIKKKESQIIETLEFQMTTSTIYEFMTICLQQLNLKEKTNAKYYNYLWKVCLYLSKMTTHDYELMNKYSYYELAGACIFVAFKIIEQLDRDFPLDEKIQETQKILGINEEVLYDSAAQILSVAKSFDKLYPNLENLKKFNGFNLDEVSNENEKNSKSSNHTRKNSSLI